MAVSSNLDIVVSVDIESVFSFHAEFYLISMYMFLAITSKQYVADIFCFLFWYGNGVNQNNNINDM